MAFTNRHSINLERDLSQNAYHADTSTLSPTGALTIEALVNLESLPTLGQSQIIMSKWTTSCCTRAYHFYVVHNLDGISLFGAVSSTGLHFVGEYQTISIPYAFSTNTWYHTAFVFTPGNKMELFVDGVSIGSITTNVPPGIFDNTAEFQVGAGIDDTGPNNFFDGKLDDVRLWGITRTALEIASNKDVELLGTESGLLGYWKFNGDALDTRVNGNHLSLRNGPVYHPEQINNAPILAPIGNMVATEGQQLSFAVSATDEDNDTLSYSASNLPSGATFDAQTRVFSWAPSYIQEGNYPSIEFTVTDSGSPMELDVESITITVGNVNRAPEFDVIGAQEVLENTQLEFAVSATGPDGDSVVLSATNMPSGATFSGGNFSWTPTLVQSGVYVVTFIATDNGVPVEEGTIDVVITVGDSPTPTEQAAALASVPW